MKKTYINPEVEIIEMQMTQAMMDAISGPSIGDDEVSSEDDLLSRDFDLW